MIRWFRISEDSNEDLKAQGDHGDVEGQGASLRPALHLEEGTQALSLLSEKASGF